ncbi:predicted dehydrogenase [Chthonomonas calidirosea]|uniref:Myo-inositol 2-dehydrogenase n=1 Tax=Chthonomonas calidirosea (strain DSM 23976 / ICMP 18418 / T49) TaxID=1303518 RepID=S0EZE1_CHTCT|nr:Gfo/Idh/MocA family oxidoreductase [Chthonomonas calidirosea]CCW35717.1 myo-inositol 2-dehydrogenase [Chthonomonas calidirosea T49]CEK19448.1 predicted dehydrogenase [Chthonomonas calidirosea]
MQAQRVAILGCGAAGKAHLERWLALAGVEVVALCDRDVAKVAPLAEQIPNCAAFTSLDDTLRDATYDIVDVCLPAPAQFEAVLAALKARAHVVCEVPFTASVAQATELIRMAELQERLLMPLFTQRFHPPCLFLQDLIENDDLGRPLMFRCRFGSSMGELSELGVVGSPNDGCASYVNAALHAIDLFRTFCGEIRRGVGRWRDKPGSPYAILVLLLESELALGTVEIMVAPPAGKSAFEVYGSAGAAVLDYEEGVLHFTTADHPLWYSRHEEGRDRLEHALSHFSEAVFGLRRLEVRGEDGVCALRVLEEALHDRSN